MINIILDNSDESRMISLRTLNTMKENHENGLKTVALNEEELGEWHDTLVSMCLDINEVCQSNGIEYCLHCGSALGAVRHDGFIPWDDDLDLVMPRKDIYRFIDAFRSEYGKEYSVLVPGETDDCRAPFLKVILRDTVLKDRNTYHTEECGVFIDIFAYDLVPNNTLERKLFKIKSHALHFLSSCRWFYEDKDLMYAIVGSDREAKRIVNLKVFIGRLLSVKPVRYWTKKSFEYDGKYRDTCNDYISDVRIMDTTLAKRDSVFPAKLHAFNNYMLPIPNNADEILTNLYGDYMQLPPKDERITHGFFEVKLPGWKQSKLPDITED